MSSSSDLRGVLAMVLAMGLLIGCDSCMKLALADAPLFQLVLVRGIAASAFCLTLILLLGQGRDLAAMFNPWLLARGLCEVVANFSFTLAIFHMPIADLTAITQTCPLFVLVGARLIFGERLGSLRIFLIGLGIAGALLVAQPGATAASPYAILGFVTALTAACRDLITRKVPAGTPPLVAAFTVIAMLMLAGGATMVSVETPVSLDYQLIALMVLAGVFMVGGQVSIFLAYRIGPARLVAPFMYSLILWAVFAGFILFGDIPNGLALVGMAVVTLSGLLNISFDGRRQLADVKA